MYVKKKNNIQENLENSTEYIKYEDTLVPGSMKKEKLLGSLDQAKNKCNEDNKCIGIVRKNVDDADEDDYYIIEDIDYCINKYNQVEEKDKNEKK